MTSLVADTHAVVWYVTNSSRLSDEARRAMREAIDAGWPVFISAVTLVELTYLVEKGRLDAEVRRLILQALRREDSGLQVVPFDLEMAETMERIPRNDVPDMPDRMIAATALYLGLPLVTADARLHNAGVPTIW